MKHQKNAACSNCGNKISNHFIREGNNGDFTVWYLRKKGAICATLSQADIVDLVVNSNA